MTTTIPLEPSYKSLFLNLQFNGAELAKGTGFVVQSSIGPVLITNRHNFTGKNNETGELLNEKNAGIPSEVAIWHNRKGQLGSWIKLVEPLFCKDKPLWFEHPRLGAQADVVGLPLTQLGDTDLYPYEFKEVDFTSSDIGINKVCFFPQLKPADVLNVVGFPYGLSMGGRFAIWVTGFVASEPGLNYPYFLIDCRARQGQSGSPVITQHQGSLFDKKSGGRITELVGVYSGRMNKDSDIGRVWKASIIKELIDSIK